MAKSGYVQLAYPLLRVLFYKEIMKLYTIRLAGSIIICQLVPEDQESINHSQMEPLEFAAFDEVLSSLHIPDDTYSLGFRVNVFPMASFSLVTNKQGTAQSVQVGAFPISIMNLNLSEIQIVNLTSSIQEQVLQCMEPEPEPSKLYVPPGAGKIIV